MFKAKLAFVLFSLCLLFNYIEVAAQRRGRRTPSSSAAAITTPSGLTYLITKKGTGRQLKKGETVVLHYTGMLTNGVKFDSSRDRNEPLAFKLGAGQVIKGYDEGLSKLRVGDHAILVIPSNLGYGSKGAGDVIPPDSKLIFVVEVVDVKSRSLADVMSTTLEAKGIEAMIAEFHRLKSVGDPDLYVGESDINGFGYSLLRRKRVNEAIEVFKLNVEAYPQSANVYDSLGEAYLIAGNKEEAIENYQKALTLDPTMESAKQALKMLTRQ
ncbi:MAG TPA: FKBP-type peptidyl-prolyl cis-trans isomerase [Pyrinomonadaceae bacterium]|nr:FKBP-type peptidyl-prolyl cis-trans isomerase [Pyrinomonadaceae bacterium]